MAEYKDYLKLRASDFIPVYGAVELAGRAPEDKFVKREFTFSREIGETFKRAGFCAYHVLTAWAIAFNTPHYISEGLERLF